jgi:hypothetical protein
LVLKFIELSEHSVKDDNITSSVALSEGGGDKIVWFVSIKQISEVKEKPFTSSLNICQKACCRKGWGLAEHPISQLISGYFFKDDLAVILLLGVSSRFVRQPREGRCRKMALVNIPVCLSSFRTSGNSQTRMVLPRKNNS